MTGEKTMAENKKLFKKILEEIKSNNKDIEATGFTEEDLEVIRKIQTLVENNDGALEEAAERIEAAEAPAEPAEPQTTEQPSATPSEPAPLPVPPTSDPAPGWMTRIEQKFNSMKPKTGLGRFFAKNRHNATLCIVLALGIVTGGWQLVDYLIPQTVTISYADFTKTDEVTIETRANTVKKVLQDTKLDISEHDYVSPVLDRRIKSGDTITIKKSVATKAEIVGVEQDFYLIPGTVEENLKFNNIVYDEDDSVTPERTAAVAADTRIVVKEVHYSTEEKKEAVAAQSVVVLDPSLGSGLVATTEGKDGEGIFTYTTTYVNGAAVSTSRELKEWITEPVDNALRLGTSITGHTGTYKVAWTFTANTTAYYMGESAYGAAGGHCVYGTCAVDPSYIPYGTVLFVEGYGVAIANDCGSAVKNNVVDLYMRSYGESVQWGRRYMKTYVLQKQ